MKKLIYAAGVLSLGGASLSVQAIEGGTKPWTVGLTVEGFHDDNIYTSPDGPSKVSSWGAYVSPSVNYGMTWDQTTLNLGASYGGYYYATDDRDDHWDHTASFSGALKHQFSPRLRLEISDTFRISQNPGQVLSGQVFRTEGDNIFNYGAISLAFDVTDRLTTVVGYSNNFYDYDNDAYAATLNRLEHYPYLDLRYMLTPKTVGVLGYKYGIRDYTADLPLPNGSNSDARNVDSHFIYGGFDHSFTPQLTGSLRGGVEIQEWSNIDVDNEVNPYVDLSLTYAYTVDSHVRLGVVHRSNATDYAGNGAGLTLQQESTVAFVNVKHAITAKLSGSLSGSFQHSEFIGGTADGDAEDWWSLGASLSYALTKNLDARVSYYYDVLTSDLPNREYDRNRFFFGITATY